MNARLPARLARTSAVLVAAVLALALTSAPGGAESTQGQSQTPAQKRAANVVTPGDFTGFGFDQCHAPDQKAMNAWLKASPVRWIGLRSGASPLPRKTVPVTSIPRHAVEPPARSRSVARAVRTEDRSSARRR